MNCVLYMEGEAVENYTSVFVFYGNDEHDPDCRRIPTIAAVRDRERCFDGGSRE